MAKLRDEWRGKETSDLKHLATEAKKMGFVENGQSGFRVGGTETNFDELKVILESAIEFHPDVPPVERLRILSQSLFDANRESKLDVKGILGIVRRVEAAYLKRKSQTFVLLTTLATRDFDDFRSLTYLGTRFSLSRQAPRKMRKARFQDRHSTLWRQLRKTEDAHSLVWVQVKVEGRTALEAGERGITAFESLRSTWNFLLNRTKRREKSLGSMPPPANDLIKGPLTTIHLPNGEFASETFWYQLPNQLVFRDGTIRQHWDYVRRNTEAVSRLLRASSLKDELLRLLRQYCSALDSCDHSSARNELWAVLERLTASGSSHEQTVRRTAFLYEDRDLHKLVLEHLRRLRNRSIHDGETSVDEQTCLYQLKRYVEDLFEFLLRSKREFNSLAEAGDFLALPYQCDEIQDKLAALNKKSKMLRSAIRFRK